MPSGLVIKQNNFGFALTFKIINADGTPRDLSGMSITFYVFTQEQQPKLLLSGACTSTFPLTGVATYAVQSGDFPTIGTYSAEIEMTVPAPPGPFTFLEDTETFNINVILHHP